MWFIVRFGGDLLLACGALVCVCVGGGGKGGQLLHLLEYGFVCIVECEVGAAHSVQAAAANITGCWCCTQQPPLPCSLTCMQGSNRSACTNLDFLACVFGKLEYLLRGF